MKGNRTTPLLSTIITATVLVFAGGISAQVKQAKPSLKAQGRLATITIDYPLEGSIFPPEITPPTFIWRDESPNSSRWRIEVTFGDGSPRVQVESRGEPMRLGEIDERCITATNELPKLTPAQAAAHTWIPDANSREIIKRHSVATAAQVTISGFKESGGQHVLSIGRVAINTSRDPVGAPIFTATCPWRPRNR